MFITGQKVMINRIHSMDNPDWIRKPQIIEKVVKVVTDKPDSCVIWIIGIPYMFSEEDLELI